MTTFAIPHFGLARQYKRLGNELLHATHEVLSSGCLVGGTFTLDFEKWLKNRIGCEYVTTVHSGTQALEFIAEYEFSIVETVETPTIRIPNLTYPATLNAFLKTGWEVEIVDTDANGILTEDTDIDHQFHRYDCLVGLYGAVPDDLPLFKRTVVDGAQHWLLVDQDEIGEGMAISFDPTKNLNASGNGGAIATDSKELYESVIAHKNNGKPDHFSPGTNSRMSELDCAHLLVRSKYIDEWQTRRKQIRQYYLKQFEYMPFKCLSRPFLYHTDQKFVIYTDQRDALHRYLRSMSIEAKIHYPYTLGELPIAANLERPTLLSTSVMLSRGVLSLPIYPELTDGEVEYIANEVKNFFEENNSIDA